MAVQCVCSVLVGFSGSRSVLSVGWLVFRGFGDFSFGSGFWSFFLDIGGLSGLDWIFLSSSLGCGLFGFSSDRTF